MKHSNSQINIKELSNNASNTHSVTIPCLIFKNHRCTYSHFASSSYIIDKDVLSQMLYELFKTEGIDGHCIPLIISLKDNAINRMESKGVYTLDSNNDQFIYLFGTKDQENFFNSIEEIKNDFKMNTSLIIGYLNNSKHHISLDHKYARELNRILKLHGNIYGMHTLLEHKESIDFSLQGKRFKINSLHWIIRNDGTDYDK